MGVKEEGGRRREGKEKGMRTGVVKREMERVEKESMGGGRSVRGGEKQRTSEGGGKWPRETWQEPKERAWTKEGKLPRNRQRRSPSGVPGAPPRRRRREHVPLNER